MSTIERMEGELDNNPLIDNFNENKLNISDDENNNDVLEELNVNHETTISRRPTLTVNHSIRDMGNGERKFDKFLDIANAGNTCPTPKRSSLLKTSARCTPQSPARVHSSTAISSRFSASGSISWSNESEVQETSILSCNNEHSPKSKATDEPPALTPLMSVRDTDSKMLMFADERGNDLVQVNLVPYYHYQHRPGAIEKAFRYLYRSFKVSVVILITKAKNPSKKLPRAD